MIIYVIEFLFEDAWVIYNGQIFGSKEAAEEEIQRLLQQYPSFYRVAKYRKDIPILHIQLGGKPK